jgi:hypothetical protein
MNMSNGPFVLMQPPMQSQDTSYSRKEPPTRIQVALVFLQQLTSKTQPRVATNDISIERIEGQKLTTAEINAQATACNMLNDYFLGKLEPDVFDKTEEHLPESPESYIRCFACGSHAQAGCVFCCGSGTVLVRPGVK